MKRIVIWTVMSAVVLLAATAAFAEYGVWEDIYSGAPGLPPGLSNTSFMGLGVGSETNLYTVGMAQTGAMDMESGWASKDGGYHFDAVLEAHVGSDVCDALLLFQFMLFAKALGPDTALFVGMGPNMECTEQFQDPLCLFICLFTMSPQIQWTDDGGETVHPANAPLNILKAPTCMDFVNDNPYIGYIGGGENLLMKTEDGGFTWENMAGLPASPYSPNGVDFITEDYGIMISGDAEPEEGDDDTWFDDDTWSDGKATTGARSEDPDVDDAVALYSKALNRWRMIHDPIYRLNFRATHPNYGEKGMNGTVYRTTDGGQTWELLYSDPNVAFYTLHMVNQNVGWMLGEPRPTDPVGFKLYKTVDGGVTWMDYTSRIPLNELGGMGYGLSAFTFNSTGQTGFLAGAAGVSGLIYKSLLFYTVDGGETWEMDKTLLPWGHPIIAFEWWGDKLAWQAGFDLSVYKYTQQNLPPIAEAGEDKTFAAKGIITLDGSGSYDPEGGAITYAWAQLSGPTVELNGADQAMPTFNATEAGAYLFELTVTDTYPESASDRVTITVEEAGDDDLVDDDLIDDDSTDDDNTDDDDAHGGDDDDSGACGC